MAGGTLRRGVSEGEGHGLAVSRMLIRRMLIRKGSLVKNRKLFWKCK